MAAKKELLKWYVDFINADIDLLPERDRWKLAADISYLTIQRSLHGPDETPDGIAEEILKIVGPSLAKTTELKSIQERLKDFLGFLMARKTSIENSEGPWKNETDFDFFPSLGGFGVNMRIRAHADIGFESRENDGQRQYRHTGNNMEKATIKLQYAGADNEETLLFHFARLLENIPLNALRRCKECNNYFIQISQREREFCSNLCASRYGVRKKRQAMKIKDPAKYDKDRKGAATRARASYERKIRKAHPKARIESRPRKYKSKASSTDDKQ